jgi:hypothetical protein
MTAWHRELTKLPKPEAISKPIFVCLHPTAMSPCVSSRRSLCWAHTSLIRADDNKTLGGWVGLCENDWEEKPHKVVGCSFVVVKDYGKKSHAKDVIEESFKCKKWTSEIWGSFF